MKRLCNSWVAIALLSAAPLMTACAERTDYQGRVNESLKPAELDEVKADWKADEKQLADPVGQILRPGGAIFVAVAGGVVVGTAAVVPHAPGEVEIVKLTVADSARGQGLGRRLAVRCLEQAKAMGARKMVLVSSSRLGPALRLYETLGFRHVPPPERPVYATADVYMELDLDGTED